MLLADYGKRLLPAEKFKGYGLEPWIKPSLGPQGMASRRQGGQENLCNFQCSGGLIEHNLPRCWPTEQARNR